MHHDSRANRLSSLGIFLVVSVLAGLLVAGLAIPVATAAGMAGTTVNTLLTQLPQELPKGPTAEKTTILASDGTTVITQLYDENRVIVPLDQIKPIMQQAQIAIEDNRYYEHGALDMKSLLKAVITNVGSSDGGGGSTLTQQYVKQFLIEQATLIPDAAEREAKVQALQARTLTRKVAEARYAIGLEQDLTKSLGSEKAAKDQILDNYLNIAYYGDGAYGVEAAAMHYYDVPASQLTLPQAAMLAGIVQTPNRNPVDDFAAAMQRRNVVIDRMLQLGLITSDEATAAEADPGTLDVQSTPNGCANDSDPTYVQVCQYIVNTLKNDPRFGSTPAEALDNLNRGGYTITTTIDPTKQEAAQAAISDRIGGSDPVKSVMVEMEPGTGKVLAAAQNRQLLAIDADDGTNYSQGRTDYQYFAPYGIGSIDEGSQAGSTFKTFIVAAALQAGIPPTYALNAPYKMTFPATDDFKECNGSTVGGTGWPVQNSSSGENGRYTMMTATAESVNTYFAQLEKTVGVCNAVTMASEAGVVTWPNNPDPTLQNIMSYGNIPAFTLGVADTSPMSMAVAYSTFANSGVRCDPMVYTSVTTVNDDGTVIPVGSPPTPNCKQVIDPDIANGVNYVLSNVFTGGTAGGYGLSGRPASGKTGTTDSGAAGWLIGYTPQIVGVAMVALDNNSYFGNRTTMAGIKTTPTAPGSKPVTLVGYGAQDAGPIWRQAMSVAVQGMPVEQFTKPSSTILNGKPVPVPSTKGMSDTDTQKALEAAGFVVTTQQIYNDAPSGQFLGASCPQRYYGATCYLQYSQGPQPPPAPTDNPSGGTPGGTGGGNGPGGGGNGPAGGPPQPGSTPS